VGAVSEKVHKQKRPNAENAPVLDLLARVSMIFVVVLHVMEMEL
jgi:hypothetical protein